MLQNHEYGYRRLLGHFIGKQPLHWKHAGHFTGKCNFTGNVSLKVIIHFTGKCDFTGNGVQSISLKLCFREK